MALYFLLFCRIIFIPVREIDFPKQHWLDQPQLLTKGQRLSSDPLIPFALRSRPMWNTLAAQTDPTLWHVAGSQAIPPQFRCRILKQFELPGTSLVGVSQFQDQMFRKVLDRVLQASSLCQRRSAMKRNKALNSLFGLTRSSALPMPWKSHYVHGTSDVIGKNATADYSPHCFLWGMEMVSIQPTLKHKYQLNNKILMEELLHNGNDIIEPRKYAWNSIIVSTTEHALWRLSLSIIFVPRFLLP